MAKCFCHELEHLDGKIFLDKAIEEIDIQNYSQQKPVLELEKGENNMPSNEYLQQVTTGEVEELNGEIVRCEYDESWAKNVFSRA